MSDRSLHPAQTTININKSIQSDNHTEFSSYFITAQSCFFFFCFCLFSRSRCCHTPSALRCRAPIDWSQIKALVDRFLMTNLSESLRGACWDNNREKLPVRAEVNVSSTHYRREESRRCARLAHLRCSLVHSLNRLSTQFVSLTQQQDTHLWAEIEESTSKEFYSEIHENIADSLMIFWEFRRDFRHRSLLCLIFFAN